ncbi:hypothetical protein Poli38472_010208 [Pythium oligandrum]|uniref:Ankyrin repeat protein n=1 Tax=Pythium oligandrum TaxID=41045 RepID=A0A8K1FF53_PYTOL|nr:hypothetical protein Poli38472_010208 [Pythium oligandrum]|eukprot:TMW58649.1 hypothetical protein Poli38472_010208 [Pythium oligandrum]
MDDAAANGDVEVMKFLHDHRSEGFTEKALDQAVGVNSGRFSCMMTVERLVSYDAECTEVSLASAFSHGRMKLLELLHGEFGCDGECIGAADVKACGANSCAMKFVCMHHPDDISADELLQANSFIKHLEMIQLLEECKIEGWLANVMDHAAAQGDLQAVQYLHEYRSEGCTEKAMDQAAAYGHLKVVKFLHENRTEGCTKRAMDGAAGKGSLDVLRYLHEHRTEGCSRVAIENAASNGHLDVIDFVLSNYNVVVTSKAVLCAAKSGKLDVLQRLLRLNPPDDVRELFMVLVLEGHLRCIKCLCDITTVSSAMINDGLVEAAKNGHWYVVSFFLAIGVSQESISEAIEGAARIGDIDTVKLVMEMNTPFRPFRLTKPYGLINAAVSGDIDLVMLLDQGLLNRIDNIPPENYDGRHLHWRAAQIAAAAAEGHLEIVEWLYQRYHRYVDDQVLCIADGSNDLAIVTWLRQVSRRPVTSEALIKAAKRGHLDILEYLPRCYPGLCEQPLVDAAAEGGSFDVIKFIHFNRPCEKCTTRAMDVAAEKGYFDIVRFHHENRGEGCSSDAIESAARNNHYTIVRYLFERVAKGRSFNAIQYEAEEGHVKIVKFLYEHPDKLENLPLEMGAVAKSRRLYMVRYLHTKCKATCSKSAFVMAAASGDLRVVRYLHENYNEVCSKQAMDEAAADSHLAVVQYLHENCTAGCTRNAMDWAFARET